MLQEMHLSLSRNKWVVIILFKKLVVKKGKSIKLNYKPKLEFSLIGISSHENDYHLSWAINKHLLLNLTRSENLSIMNKQHEIVQVFAVSSYDDEETMLLYNLISNSGEKGFLFPELRNIDYFLQIYGELNETQLISFTKSIKEYRYR